MVYKIKRFSYYNNTRNWGTDGTIPKGAIMYPYLPYGPSFSDYGEYNVVWEDPDNPGDMINNFVLDSYDLNNNFLSDKMLIDSNYPILSKRLEIILNDLSNGEFVFDDNDEMISRKYRSSDPVYKGWDTCTHYLQNYLQRNNNKSLTYSKDLDKDNRLTYDVLKPVRENGAMTCHVKVSRCFSHRYNTDNYGRNFSEVLHNIREGNISDSTIS